MERHIQTSAELTAPLAAVRDVLRHDPSILFPEGASPQQRRPRRYTAMVGAPIGASTVVEHQVAVELGSLVVASDEVSIPLWWEPIGNEHLLPSFEGFLLFRSGGERCTVVCLRGVYRIPLGPMGRFGDTVVGHRIARRSMAELVEGIARRLGLQATQRDAAASVRPAPAPADLRDHPSDLYLG